MSKRKFYRPMSLSAAFVGLTIAFTVTEIIGLALSFFADAWFVFIACVVVFAFNIDVLFFPPEGRK